MGVHCPSCSAEVPDVVPTETLTSRLKAKDEANKLLEARIREIEPKVATFDAVVAERDTLKASLTRAAESAERERALMPILAKESDPAKREELRQSFELFYSSLSAPEGETLPAFGEFDKWAKDHVLLGRLFAEEPAGQQSAQQQAAPRPNGLPRATGTSPASAPVKETPAGMEQWFRSSEARAMTSEERLARLDEMRQRGAAQGGGVPGA
jgi:hypothetical protein